jgi:hypothetical protein
MFCAKAIFNTGQIFQARFCPNFGMYIVQRSILIFEDKFNVLLFKYKCQFFTLHEILLISIQLTKSDKTK